MAAAVIIWKHLTVGRLGEFLEDVKSGRVEKSSWLGIEDFDRLSRQNYWDAKAVFEEIVNASITIVTFKDARIFDLQSIRKNPFEFMMALMSMVGANEYTERMSTRAKDAWKSKREAAVTTGKIMSANVPVWINTIVDEVSPSGRVIRRHFELNEEKSAIVRQIIDLFLNGFRYETVAQNSIWKMYQCSHKGESWMPGSIRAILQNEALCGRYIHREKRNGKAVTIIESYYLPIVTRATYDEIKLLLKSNHKSKTRAINSLANPLQGLCFCTCGSLMTRVSQRAYRGRKPYQKLVCIGAKTGKHKYKSIELETVMRHLWALFEFPMLFNPNEHDAMTPLQAKLSEVDGRIEHTTTAIAKVGISEALQRSLKGLETERAAVVKLIEEEAQKAVYGDMKRMSELTVEA